MAEYFIIAAALSVGHSSFSASMSANDEKRSKRTTQLHRLLHYTTDKEGRSNSMMAHRHKMNHGFRRAVLGLFLQGITIITPGNYRSEKKKKCPQCIECIMDLIYGVTSGISCETKSDCFLSVD